MDRQIVYPGQIPLETDLLNTNKFAMVAIAKLAGAMFGTTTLVNGLACVPTGPASLQVVVNPGEIYSLANVDATAYSSLPADTSHSILKQGISMDPVTLNCPAPVTAGQSVNYLIQATYQDSDTGLVTLPYYNASNPSQAWSGPNNNGSQQATARKGIVTISAKAGIAATTGSQTTPAPDAGYTGLWVVTVANGQTAINSGNIVKAAGAPILTETLLDKISLATGDARYLQTAQGVGRLLRVSVFAIVSGVQQVSVDGGAFTTSGATVFTPRSDTSSIIVEQCGAGGGSGATTATGAAAVSVTGGGGVGASARDRYTSGFAGASVTVGVGGAAGVAPGGNGGTGGTTSFGALRSTIGGFGSIGVGAIAPPYFANGGGGGAAPSGGNISRGRGADGTTAQTANTTNFISGTGGNSVFGAGGTALSATGPGNAGQSPGSGAGGAATGISAAAQAGAKGADGIVIVYEYA